MDTIIKNAYTQVENVNIHYLYAGKGETILLLHGWPTSSYLWRNMIPSLAENYQVIAMDLPGFGKSDKILNDSYSFRYYNRILSGFLKNLEVENLTLGLHDLGGPIGLYYLVQNMKKVNRLILFNTLVYPKFSTAVKLFVGGTMMPGIRNYLSSPTGIKKAIYFGVNQKEKLTDEIIQNYQAPFPDKTSRKVLLKTVQRMSVNGFKEISDQLSSYKGPVQILYGEKDKILPGVGNTMKKVKQQLPHAKLTSYPDCGHFLQEEIALQLSQEVATFMKT